MPAQDAKTIPGAVRYGQLTQRHPEYDDGYWAELRALYEGGKRLLRDEKLMERLFPKHQGESEESYTERKKRAFYVNHLGTVVDFTVAGLAQDKPVPVEPSANDKGGSLAGFYAAFVADTSPAGGVKVPFSKLVLESLRTAALLGRAYVLCDMPPAAPFASLADQQAAGALNAYAVELAPESIVDWELDDAGGFLWVLHYKAESRRVSLLSSRADVVSHVYTLYTPTEWTRYRVNIEREKPEPDKDALIQPEESGKHYFGRVPVVRLEMPAGLWVGNKAFSLAVEHFNKACGLSWAEFRTLYQQLYEFLAPEYPGVDTPISTAQQDPHRAKRQVRGPGWVQQRGDKDRAEFVGPDTGGFAHALGSLKQITDYIYRVTYQMALGQDVDGATIRRSADSKARDAASTEVVLGALGEIGRDFGRQVMDMIAAGRREQEGWTITGLAKFDVQDMEALVNQAVAIEGISIPSAEYQVLHKKRLAVTHLGELATPKVAEQIETELRGVITQDQFSMAAEAAAEAPENPPDEEDQPAVDAA